MLPTLQVFKLAMTIATPRSFLRIASAALATSAELAEPPCRTAGRVRSHSVAHSASGMIAMGGFCYYE